jgi:glycosyltransferase involved in cell wall biosynthesis
MNTAPRLSILVPAYNAQQHLDATLRSVLEQMGPSHELVVIDDGSRDATSQVVERLQEAYPALATRLIRQDNAGLATTRNRLLDAAAGEYILFLDADDLVLPGTLTELDAIIAAHRPDVIACDFNDWHPHNMRRTRRMERGYPAATLVTDREAILRTFFMDRQCYAWANVMRREIYARQPAPLYPPGRTFEDITVTPQLIADCASLVRLARPCFDYRQHPGSMKRGLSHKWCTDFAQAVLHTRRHFAHLPLSDALRLHIDAATVHYYIVILKRTYEMPWREGRAARADVRALLGQNLFHELGTVLAAMEGDALDSHDRQADRRAASQMRKLLAGNPAFVLGKLVARKIKVWQRKAAA